jgi:general secretion pathway protein G
MTVIVVILTLASIVTPAFRTLIVRGREAVLREDLFTLRAQIDRFIHDYGRGPTSLEELVEKEYMGSIPADPLTGSNQTPQVENSGQRPVVSGSGSW